MHIMHAYIHTYIQALYSNIELYYVVFRKWCDDNSLILLKDYEKEKKHQPKLGGVLALYAWVGVACSDPYVRKHPARLGARSHREPVTGPCAGRAHRVIGFIRWSPLSARSI